jgi:signal peptide peptidase SppA
MTVRKTKVLDFYASKHWAILPETLQEMYQLYTEAIDRKETGANLDIEAVAAKLGRPLDNSRTVTMREGIAILPVSGPIFRYANLFTEISGATSIEVLATDFRRAMEDPAVRAIILEVNSPGGEVDGTSEFAQHVFEARGQKPIIGYISHLGASAGYWIPSACDEIVCADTAMIGSIGVVGAARISKDKNVIEFVSSQSPNKRPNPQTEAGRAQLQKHVDDLAQVFIETIARNRSMSAEAVVDRGAAGGLMIGRLAVEAGLADRVGTLEGVIAELSDSNSEKPNTRATLQTKGVETMADKVTTDKKDTDNKPDATLPPKAEAKDAPVDDKSAELAAAQAENEKLKAQLAETLSAKETQDKELSTVKASVEDLQKQARTSRFAELAKGWPGASVDNLAMLEHLATSSGEDSDLFKAHVTSMDAAKAQIEAGNLLKEIGSNAPVEGSASAEIDAKAKKRSEESQGKETYQQSYDAIYAADPSLRSRVDAEERRSVN